MQVPDLLLWCDLSSDIAAFSGASILTSLQTVWQIELRDNDYRSKLNIELVINHFYLEGKEVKSLSCLYIELNEKCSFHNAA